MKNVFFALAFTLVGTFTFASTGEVKTVEDNSIIENVVNLEQISLDNEALCLFEFSWDTAEHGTGSLWIDCGETDDSPFDFEAFINTIIENFL